MDARQSELWKRLESFEIDSKEAEWTFAGRLARECAWSRGFAEEVVEEYKRFLLLAVTAGHPVTPSEEVDQAWHLHLVYSRSYWEDLCGRVLGCPLHHSPTRGGSAEDGKFRSWYESTLRSYARVFGTTPPARIWPAARRRFAKGARFRHLDSERFFLLPKRAMRWGGSLAGTVLGASCALNADVDPDTGKGLLLMFGLLTLLVVVVLRAKRRPLRRKGGSKNDSGGGCGFFPTGCGDGSSGESSGCGADGGSGCGGGGCGGD